MLLLLEAHPVYGNKYYLHDDIFFFISASTTKGINSHLHAGKNIQFIYTMHNKILTIGSSTLKYKIMT